MPSRSEPPNDRLAAILAELDEGRRTPWVPAQDDVMDRRPLWPRGRRRKGQPTPEAFEPLGTQESEDPVVEQTGESESTDHSLSRAQRRARRLPGRDIQPHVPLFRSPLPDAELDTRPGRSALFGALAVLLVVGVVFAVRVWTARSSAQPVPLTATSASTAASQASSADRSAGTSQPASGPSPAASSTASSSTGPRTVLVHVVGQVNHPGVVRLSAGARVDDAIRAAGGAAPSADLSAVNLAREVSDGEQVHVPKPGETPRAQPPAPVPGSSAAAAGPSASTGLVNLNTAGESELDTLPGVGPVLAARIVQWRATNGRFSSVDELGEVSGIGEKLLSQLRPLVTV